MSPVFADTSALYALLVAGDSAHDAVRDGIEELERAGARLVTNSYVVHETVALLQARSGPSAC